MSAKIGALLQINVIDLAAALEVFCSRKWESMPFRETRL